MKERPELGQIVLQRRPTENDSLLRSNTLQSDRDVRFRTVAIRQSRSTSRETAGLTF